MSDRGTNYEVTDSFMQRLFKATVKDLLDKIESGEATPQDRATAARLCKENGIGAVMDIQMPDKATDLGLPEFDDV